MKALASFYGMAIGDSWGHLYEFMPYNKNPSEKYIENLTEKEFEKKNGVGNKFKLRPG